MSLSRALLRIFLVTVFTVDKTYSCGQGLILIKHLWKTHHKYLWGSICLFIVEDDENLLMYILPGSAAAAFLLIIDIIDIDIDINWLWKAPWGRANKVCMYVSLVC